MTLYYFSFDGSSDTQHVTMDALSAYPHSRRQGAGFRIRMSRRTYRAFFTRRGHRRMIAQRNP